MGEVKKAGVSPLQLHEGFKPSLLLCGDFLEQCNATEPHTEIEIRWVHTLHAQQGVTKNMFFHALSRLREGSWKDDVAIQPEQKFTHTYFQRSDEDDDDDDEEEKGSKKIFRSTTLYDEETMEQTTNTCEKIKLSEVIFPLFFQDRGSREASLSSSFHLKLVISKEIPWPHEDETTVVIPTWVRVCHRFSFLLTPSKRNHPVFRFDLTRVWEAATWPRVEQMMVLSEMEECKYEIELELIDPLELSRQSPALLAFHMFKLMHDLLIPDS